MKTEIDIILMELLIFLHPDYFIPRFQIEKNIGEKFNKKKLNEYHMIITGINWFIKKTSKYGIYFNNFYPDSNKISKHEALEHHIHAYLEDLETLRNKLINFVNTIKNDSIKIFQNKDEIKTYNKSIKNTINKAFSNVSENRNPHRHGVYRFVDKYVADGEMASTILSENFTILKHRLTQYGLEKLQQQEKESFEKGKKYWSQNANEYFIQVQGLTNEIIKNYKNMLFKIIDIKPFGINTENK